MSNLPTNDAVLQYASKHTYNATATWLSSLSPEHAYGWPALVAAIKDLKKTKQSLTFRKNDEGGKESLENFLQETFVYPPPVTPGQEKVSKVKESTLSSELNLLQQSNPGASGSITEAATTQLQKQNEALQEELDEKNTLIEHLQEELKEKTVTIVNMEKTIQRQIFRSESLSQTLKRVRSGESYQRGKVAQLESKVSEMEASTSARAEEFESSSESETEDLQNQIIELEHQVSILEEQLASSDTFEMYDEIEKRYTTEVHNCVHKLLNLNIAACRVPSCIEAVLNLVGKTANRLHSVTTINRMNLERLVLAQKQITEDVAGASHTTLEMDETSKYGSKFMAYALRTESGQPYVLGLRDILTKSGEDTLNTLKQILWDLDQLYFDAQDEDSDITISHHILYNLRNTMSDRAATELKFNELLELYRKEILPDVINNWEELTEDMQTQLSRLNNFFCGLHGLVHIAESANKNLQECEDHHFGGKAPISDQRFRKATESGVCRLVRTACQAFAYGGDAKNGCHGRFSVYVKDFLKQHNFHSLPLTPYKGNRFNILFYNAGSVGQSEGQSREKGSS